MTPPFSEAGRKKAGQLLAYLQLGVELSMPLRRPMPSIGRRVSELRFDDGRTSWRIVYREDADAIIVMDYFKKKGNKTPKSVIDRCKRRLAEYDRAAK